MTKFFTLLVFLFCLGSHAQITITGNDLPDGGDTLVTRNATLDDGADFESSGPDHQWNFGLDILQPNNLNTGIPCYPLSETPFLFQILFNNQFFDPAHYSAYAIGVQQAAIGPVTFEDAYQYHQNDGEHFAVTGLSATINSVPLAAQMNDPDVIYDLPLQFGNTGASHSKLNFDIPTIGSYGMNQYRTYECDGWGTLHIWGEDFEVLRVKSIVIDTDSVFTSLLGFGFSLPQPETTTYEWISTEYKVPILSVTTVLGAITQVQTADIYEPVGVEENTRPAISVYPNPVVNELRVSGTSGRGLQLFIYDGSGALVLSKSNSTFVDVSTLARGAYCIHIVSGDATTKKLFIKE